MNPIRLLTAREIECRVAQISKKGDGLSLLLYKDARADMAILDETFGPMNWQRRHCRDNANCIVSIWDSEKKCWVEKEDTGTESNTEAEKGLASDSFKRACFNVGIGRELYTAPFIWVTPPNCKIVGEDGRYKCFDRFEVSEIGYNEHREINRLVIVNAKTKNVVFEYGTSSNARKGPSKPAKAVDDKSIVQPPKAAQNGAQAVTGNSTPMCTAEQKQFIRLNALDEDYMAIMEEYGAELENLTAADAEREIARIKANTDAMPTCERCGKIITGIALPDGSTMTGADLVGKSKVTYNGVFCFECMRDLNKKRKAG